MLPNRCTSLMAITETYFGAHAKACVSISRAQWAVSGILAALLPL